MASSLMRTLKELNGEDDEALVQCVVGEGRWFWPLVIFCYLEGLGGLVVGGLCLYLGSLLIEQEGGSLFKGLFLLLYGPASFCVSVLFLASIILKRPSLAKPFVLLLLGDFLIGFVDAFIRQHWTTLPAMMVVFVCIVCADGLRQKLILDADESKIRAAVSRRDGAQSALLFRPSRGARLLGRRPLPIITVTAPDEDGIDRYPDERRSDPVYLAV